MTDLTKLRKAIRASGLSRSAFARTVLVRDPRTLRRWLAGTNPIPKAVTAQLGVLDRKAKQEVTP
jgi:hypothetical protein